VIQPKHPSCGRCRKGLNRADFHDRFFIGLVTADPRVIDLRRAARAALAAEITAAVQFISLLRG